jgi:hypothetical protein
MRITPRGATILLLALTLCVLSSVPPCSCAELASAPPEVEALNVQNPGAEKHNLKSVFLASGFVLGSLAAILEIESDRAYSSYLEVANPVRMHSYYDKAERYRNLSSAALIGAQVCAVAFVVLSVSEEAPKETESRGVRITMYTGVRGAGVSLEW